MLWYGVTYQLKNMNKNAYAWLKIQGTERNNFLNL